jgi:hypothetical protein
MRALFLDWGGTLALTKDNRTVIDAEGRPVLMPNVAATLARERRHFGGCFIVSNQARVSRGEISEPRCYAASPGPTSSWDGRSPTAGCARTPTATAANAASLVRGCSSS